MHPSTVQSSNAEITGDLEPKKEHGQHDDHVADEELGDGHDLDGYDPGEDIPNESLVAEDLGDMESEDDERGLSNHEDAEDIGRSKKAGSLRSRHERQLARRAMIPPARQAVARAQLAASRAAKKRGAGDEDVNPAATKKSKPGPKKPKSGPKQGDAAQPPPSCTKDDIPRFVEFCNQDWGKKGGAKHDLMKEKFPNDVSPRAEILVGSIFGGIDRALIKWKPKKLEKLFSKIDKYKKKIGGLNKNGELSSRSLSVQDARDGQGRFAKVPKQADKMVADGTKPAGKTAKVKESERVQWQEKIKKLESDRAELLKEAQKQKKASEAEVARAKFMAEAADYTLKMYVSEEKANQKRDAEICQLLQEILATSDSLGDAERAKIEKIMVRLGYED